MYPDCRMFKLIAFIVVIPATVLSSIAAMVQTALAPGRTLSDRKSRVGCQEGLRRSLRYRSMVVERHKNQGFEFKPLPAAKSAPRILATERQ